MMGCGSRGPRTPNTAPEQIQMQAQSNEPVPPREVAWYDRPRCTPGVGCPHGRRVPDKVGEGVRAHQGLARPGAPW